MFGKAYFNPVPAIVVTLDYNGYTCNHPCSPQPKLRGGGQTVWLHGFHMYGFHSDGYICHIILVDYGLVDYCYYAQV